MSVRALDTLLIANRGEIACRIIRTARRLGIRSVAVYSEADRDALHVRQADVAVPIGPAPARESYLDMARILAACRVSGAQAVHPGYGFLSENADFARACAAAGLIFVGPPASAIDALGNKSAAKQLAERIGVPCLPGYAGSDQSVGRLVEEARRIGAPLMIKAAAGGGGRGMRRCDDVGDTAALEALLEAARNEALASFGNGDLLLERLLETARHVEVQVFGDTLGHHVHLGERDCSTQRRNQKILEEAPAPGVSAALRERMGEAAIHLAREVGYVGAGTIEFLLAPDDSFSFLEMNTRLQVEHPVTEAITGLDLVEWQLRVARGEPLPLEQAQIRFEGHAIEARLCAEDAFGGFVPQSGPIEAWRLAEGCDVRVDHGLTAQPSIPPYYDSMIAKLVSHADDREGARRKLIAGLEASTVAGVITNRDYLIRCLEDRHFVAPDLSTRWLDRTAGDWQAPSADAAWLAAAAILWTARKGQPFGELSNWASLGAHEVPLRLRVGETVHALGVRALGGDQFQVTVDGRTLGGQLSSVRFDAPGLIASRLSIDGLTRPWCAKLDARRGYLQFGDYSAWFEDASTEPPARQGSEQDGRLSARMHGMVVAVSVVEGQRVDKNQWLLSIEAMKMEHRIAAPIAGVVRQLSVSKGQQVAPGAALVQIEADPA